MNEEIKLEEVAPWLAITIALIGGFLRILLLGTKGMWLDETFSVWLASHSLAEIMQWIVRIDQHPPLYYIVLHYWMARYGDTPYYVRLLSVLFGVATIPVIYLTGKRMSGGVLGLAAAVLLALSPFNIYFAQEARMYTLLTFNAAVAIYALVRLLTDPRSLQPIGSQFREYLHAWRTSGSDETNTQRELIYKEASRNQTGWRAWISRHRWLPIQTVETDLAWVAFIVFSAATLLTHNTAVFFPLATNIFVLGLMLFERTRRSAAQPGFQAPSFGNWAKAQISIFLLWSPWIFFFIKQAGAVYQRFWIPEPTWDIVIRVLGSFLNASGSMLAGQATVVWSLYVLVLCLGLVYYRKNFSRFLFLATLFAIPFLGELVVSSWRPIFWGRTLIWTTIPLFLLLAAGIAQLRFNVLILVLLGSLGTLKVLPKRGLEHPCRLCRKFR
jgi:mannosyltransferase